MNSRRIIQILYRKNLFVDFDGSIYRLIKSPEKILLIFVILLVITIFHLFTKIPYYPVTIIGNTIYAKSAATILTKYKISHKYGKFNNKLIKYLALDDEEVDILGYNSTMLNIPLTNEEMENLKKHTNLANIVNLKPVNPDKYDHPECTIKSIEQIFPGLYYINNTWLTKSILTDTVSSLQEDDAIIGMNKKDEIIFPIFEDSKAVIIDSTKWTVTQAYNIDKDLNLRSIQGHNSPWYQLAKCRSFTGESIHPFHLPFTWNPVLAVMMVTLAYVKQ